MDAELLNRRGAIQEFRRFGTPLPPFTMEMKDCDLLEVTYDVYETGAQSHVEFLLYNWIWSQRPVATNRH